jgi:hypothetical protein
MTPDSYPEVPQVNRWIVSISYVVWTWGHDSGSFDVGVDSFIFATMQAYWANNSVFP